MSTTRRPLAPERWLAALVAAAAVAAFSPALLNGFVIWDDDVYLLRNLSYRGLGPAQLRWVMSNTKLGHYMPLTWLSFALDYRLWGMEPGGYHLTNLLLHALVSALCFFFLHELLRAALPGERDATLAPWGAAAAALMFAVHPLRVESVAWAVERKDVLCGVFWAGSLLAYARGRAKTSLALFALALLSKISCVTLPAALLVLDVYPLRRLPADPRRWLEARWRGVWREKAAFGLVAAAALAVSFASLRLSGDLHDARAIGWGARASQIVYGLWFYPAKTLWPSGLCAFHPIRAWFGSLWPWTILLGAGAAAVAALAWALRRRAPGVPAALLAFALLAAPALGGVQNGMPFSACDRYGYLPCVPLAALFGAAVVVLARRRRAAAILGAAAVAAALGARAYAETGYWRDTRTLWSRALAVEPDSYVAANNLGVGEAEDGRLDEALVYFRKAAAFPGYTDALANLGVALARTGRLDEARQTLRRAYAAFPTPRLAFELGSVLSLGSRREKQAALTLLRLAEQDGQPRASALLGDALAGLGRGPEAARAYESAVAADPGDGAALNNLGLLLDSQRRRADARARYRLALRAPAWRATAHYNWGNSLLADGRTEEADRHYAEALRLDPGFGRARVNRANILARRGFLKEAATLYREALKRDPGLVEARVNLSAVERALRR